MKNKMLLSFVVVVITSLSCNFLSPSSTNSPVNVPVIPVVDFVTPAEPLNVIVQLDDASTASSTITPAGGSLTLTAVDGTAFMLDIPAEALTADTLITMTVVKSIEGAPLDNNTPSAVQLEPSGLLFDEFVTLTILPAQEIPIENQIIFGYEGSGDDYHLAVVDSKSKDIKIKLMEFSGAGVGTGSDAAWAANLQIQASNASTRLWQKWGEFSQKERQGQIFGTVEDSTELANQTSSTLDQFEDQVVLKELVAAELDCKFAPQAVRDLLLLGRARQLLFSKETPGFSEKLEKLSKIIMECKWAYQIVGGLDDWQTDTVVCDILTPFTLTGGGISVNFSGGLSGTYTYTGLFNSNGTGTYTISLANGIGSPGTMTGGGVGSAGGASNSGTETYTLTPMESCN